MSAFNFTPTAPALNFAGTNIAPLTLAPPDTPPPFVLVPFSDLSATEPLPPHVFWWGNYIPAKAVTLLAGHGGTGKSMISLMLAVCVAMGVPLFGVPTKQGKVVFFSGEDPAEVVLSRLQAICLTFSITPRALEGWLTIIDATEGDPVLYSVPEHGNAKEVGTTATYALLVDLVRREQTGLVIVDNASDTLDANENTRAPVQRFIRALARAVSRHGGAVLLLSHVDKGTSRAGSHANDEGYSGNTAWNNSVRSRLFIRKDKEIDGVVIEHKKGNYSKGLSKPLQVTWHLGALPELALPMAPGVRTIIDTANAHALLQHIHEFTSRGEYVGTSTAKNATTNAGALFLGTPGFPPGLSKDDVVELLRTAERKEWVERRTYRRAGRHPGERWEVTALGRAEAGIREDDLHDSQAADSGQPNSSVSEASSAEPAQSAPSERQVEHGALDAHTGDTPPACAPSAQGVIGGESARADGAELGAQDQAMAADDARASGEHLAQSSLAPPQDLPAASTGKSKAGKGGRKRKQASPQPEGGA